MSERVDVEALCSDAAYYMPRDTWRRIRAEIRALGSERDEAEKLLLRALGDEDGLADWVKPAERLLKRAGLLAEAGIGKEEKDGHE